LSQQVPPPPSRLRKGFLVIGLVLLILGFFFFYLGSVTNIDHVTTYQNVANLNSGGMSWNLAPLFGSVYIYPANPQTVQTVTVQPHDYLTVSFQNVSYGSTNGTIYIVFFSPIDSESESFNAPPGGQRIVAYSPYGSLDFTNKANFETTIQVYLFSQNTDNIIPIITTLNHYERPQWVYFGVGVVLSLLAVIPIFKSKK